MNNQKIGSNTEENILSFFKKKKYWAHFLSKGISGQPFDIISCRKEDIWFADAKHLDDNKVSFSYVTNIEPNQITSMLYAKNIAEVKGHIGFIIEHRNTLYFLDFNKYLKDKELNKKSVKIKDLQKMEEII